MGSLPRALVAAAALCLTGTACGTEGTEGIEGLPACAAGLPLPDAVEVVEVTATPQPENPTCAVTLESEEPVDDVVVAWRAALDDAGIDHAAQAQPGRQAVLSLRGPICGSILVFAAGTERVTEAVGPDRTPALASITACS